MADITGGAKATAGFFKNHWIAAIVVVVAIVAVALAYDHKNNGKLTNMVAGIPILGKLFA
jgi:type II secretory pathway component PulF